MEHQSLFAPKIVKITYQSYCLSRYQLGHYQIREDMRLIYHARRGAIRWSDDISLRVS